MKKNLIKSRSKLTTYGSLKKTSMKISRKGIYYYTYKIRTRYGEFSAYSLPKTHNILINNSRKHNRIHLKLIRTKYNTIYYVIRENKKI